MIWHYWGDNMKYYSNRRICRQNMEQQLKLLIIQRELKEQELVEDLIQIVTYLVVDFKEKELIN